MNAPRAIAAQPKRGALPADWSDDHDARLRDTKGRYSKIAKLSDKWGIATGALVARWHLLRAGAAPARGSSEDHRGKLDLREGWAFKRMRAGVTQQMAGVVDFLRGGKEVPADTVMWDLRLSRRALDRCIELNAARMRVAGWQVVRTDDARTGVVLKLERLS